MAWLSRHVHRPDARAALGPRSGRARAALGLRSCGARRLDLARPDSAEAAVPQAESRSQHAGRPVTGARPASHRDDTPPHGRCCSSTERPSAPSTARHAVTDTAAAWSACQRFGTIPIYRRYTLRGTKTTLLNKLDDMGPSRATPVRLRGRFVHFWCHFCERMAHACPAVGYPAGRAQSSSRTGSVFQGATLGRSGGRDREVGIGRTAGWEVGRSRGRYRTVCRLGSREVGRSV